MFAPAEGQIVDDAGGEVVVEIDPGKSPIQFVPIGKRKVGGTIIGTQTIGKPRVVSARVGVANQGVDSVTGALGLGLNLQTIVVSEALVGGSRNSGEREGRQKGAYEGCPTWPATALFALSASLAVCFWISFFSAYIF